MTFTTTKEAERHMTAGFRQDIERAAKSVKAKNVSITRTYRNQPLKKESLTVIFDLE